MKNTEKFWELSIEGKMLILVPAMLVIDHFLYGFIASLY